MQILLDSNNRKAEATLNETQRRNKKEWKNMGKITTSVCCCYQMLSDGKYRGLGIAFFFFSFEINVYSMQNSEWEISQPARKGLKNRDGINFNQPLICYCMSSVQLQRIPMMRRFTNFRFSNNRSWNEREKIFNSNLQGAFTGDAGHVFIGMIMNWTIM